MRRGATLVELFVVIFIIATISAFLIPAALAVRERAVGSGKESASSAPPVTNLLHTVSHDGHLWVMGWSLDGGSHATHFVHHPDCPCRGRKAEAED